jgi:peptide/nickel transport system substrate-binding protein
VSHAPFHAHPRRAGLLAAAIFAASLALSAAALADDPKPVTGGTLTYLEQQAHTNIYPPAAGFYPNGGIDNQITDKLTYQDPKTLKILPWLAESWTVNADDTQYTFKIRKGVTFSDGTPLDANAVAKNFDTYGLGNKDLKLPVSEVINNYDHSEVIDPLTVKFYFKKPSPGFLQGTSVIGSGIVALSTLAHKYDDLGLAPNIIGSGPFVVSNEVLGKEVDLKVRPDYNWAPPSFAHQGRAYLDGINIIVTPEDSVRIGSLTSGQADFIRQIQAFDEQQVGAQGFQIYAAPTRGVNDAVAFRPDNSLVSDLRVRQALLHATNSQEIVDTLFSANYPKATAVIASVAAGYENLSDKLKFDPELSKKLLDQAGWVLGSDGLRHKDGKTLELAIHVSIPQPQNQAVLELVGQQWAKVGVKLDVLSGSAGNVVTDNLDPEKTPLSVAEVGRADPDVIKSEFYPLNRDALLQKGGSSSKVVSFTDPKLNGLLEAVAAETDPTKRIADAKTAQEYILDQAYEVPFFEEPQVFAGAPYVHGIEFEAVGRPSFYDTWIAAH